MVIPFFFLRKKPTWKKIYSRLFLGFCFFFVVYWFLPALLQFEVHSLDLEPNQQNRPGLAFGYLFLHTFSLITSYFQYPFVILPFIFIVSPFIALFILFNRIKKEKNDNEESVFNQLNYEYYSSPKEMIFTAINNKDWSKEKEMFKAFLIILPISLYLLTAILDLAKLEPVNVTESSTALGWFIEIFFVYLATFLFGYQLIKASRISFKGRFIGEQIESRFFGSLKQIGTPIAILSILLFIVQKTDSLPLMFFFFAYFLMAAFIFIVFMRLFEPISILIFLKIINAIKWRKRSKNPLRTMKIEISKPLKTSYIRIISYAIIASTITFLVYFIMGSISVQFSKDLDPNFSLNQIISAGSEISFNLAVKSEILINLHTIELILRVTIIGYFFAKCLQTRVNNIITFFIFGIILLGFTWIFSLIFEGNFVVPLTLTEATDWLTGVPVILDLFSFDFYTIRTGFLQAGFENNTLLRILAIPFSYLSPFVNIVLVGFLLTFIRRSFTVKTFEKQKNYVERVTFSNIFYSTGFNPRHFFEMYPDSFLKFNQQMGKLFQLSSIDEYSDSNPEKTKNKSKNQEKKYTEVFLKELDTTVMQREGFNASFNELFKENFLEIWIPEFSCIYERAQLDSIYILYEDGRNLYNYDFHEGDNNNLAPYLISGMFSAITSFVREATHSRDFLRAIDNGDKKVLLEYSDDTPIFAALFADRENATVRTALRTFLHEFQKKHEKTLEKWEGDISPFTQDDDLIPEVFGDFL